MKFLFASLLFALNVGARAEIIRDDILQFSIDAPGAAAVERGATPRDSSVSVTFRDGDHNETVVVRARRLAKGGKFGIPIPTVFGQIVAGMSSSMGTDPAEPIRTLSHQDRTFYVATHLNMRGGDGSPKGVTTVAYFAEKDTWHKVILLQFMTDANTVLSDAELRERFTRLKYDPES